MPLATGLPVSTASAVVSASVATVVPNTSKGDQADFLGLNTIEILIQYRIGNQGNYISNTIVSIQNATVPVITNVNYGLLNGGLTNGLSYVSAAVVTDFRTPVVIQANNWASLSSLTQISSNPVYTYGSRDDSNQQATTVITNVRTPAAFGSNLSTTAVGSQLAVLPFTTTVSIGSPNPVVGFGPNYTFTSNVGFNYPMVQILTDYYTGTNTLINLIDVLPRVFSGTYTTTGNTEHRQIMSPCIVAIKSNNDINLFINRYITDPKPVTVNTITQSESFNPFNAYAELNRATVVTNYYGGPSSLIPSITPSTLNAVAVTTTAVDMPNNLGPNNYPYRPYNIRNQLPSPVFVDSRTPAGNLISSIAASILPITSVTINDMVAGGTAKPFNIQNSTQVITANTNSSLQAGLLQNVTSVNPIALPFENYLIGGRIRPLYTTGMPLWPVRVDTTAYSPITFRFNSGFAQVVTNLYSIGGTGGEGGVSGATAYWS